MAITCFICKITNDDTLKKIVQSIKHHNKSDCENTGITYTDKELEIGDPTRFEIFKMLKNTLPNITLEFSQKWTRGEDISESGYFIKYKDSIWIETTNNGGGLCTSMWFKNNYPELNWIGSEGKPSNWKNYPIVAEFDNLENLLDIYQNIKK